ncbi:MAG: leucine-rich repeat domain-containing protein [Clostridia bacterium]|nr:leucine-rich repeat domain-containing protein [Clostridia bacterium]
MKRSYYDDFILVVGTREDIVEIAKIIYKENAQKVIEGLSEGKYVLLKINRCIDIDAKQIKEKYPSCELFVYHGAGRHGCCDYELSYAGDYGVLEDSFYVDYDGNLVMSFGGRLIFEEKTVSESITIHHVDGRKNWYISNKDSEKLLDSLLSQPLTLGLLSDICNPYTAPKKRREFVDSIISSFPSIDMVTAIEYEKETKTALDECFIEKIAKTELAQKFSDITVLRFLGAKLVEKEKKFFDYTTNTATLVKTSVIYAMDDPASGKYNVVEVEYEKAIEKVEKIPGFIPSDHIDILYVPSEENSCICTKCLSDIEIIRVPDEIDGLTVAAIGDGCFEKLTKVKKIILPCTVKSIGKGAFAGCKKLTAVVYADNPDSKDDFVICNKGKLITLFTKQTSYIVPDDVSEIGKNAFSNCQKLKEVTLRPGMKKLLNDSLVECKSLKTINLSGNTDNINITALEKGGIKEVILPAGETVSVYDKYMFSCFTHTSNGMEFSYQAAAEKLSSAGSESAKFKIAMDCIENHLQEIDDAVATNIFMFAVKHTIGSGDAETLSKLLEMELVSRIDFTDMVQQANRCGNLEIAAMILNKSGQGGDNKKTIIRHETPAEPLSGWSNYMLRFVLKIIKRTHISAVSM